MDVPRYVGIYTIGRYVGVTGAAVANWRQRHPDTVPQPDAYVDGVGVWLEASLPAWKRWAAQTTRRAPRSEQKRSDA